jgi:hypothetical protein
MTVSKKMGHPVCISFLFWQLSNAKQSRRLFKERCHFSRHIFSFICKHKLFYTSWLFKVPKVCILRKLNSKSFLIDRLKKMKFVKQSLYTIFLHLLYYYIDFFVFFQSHSCCSCCLHLNLVPLGRTLCQQFCLI